MVIICTPDHLHREPAVAAARAGKHILLEKPMAQTLEDADAIIEAVDRAGVTLMVAHVLRFETSYVKIREAIAAGGIGRPLSFYGRQSISIADVRAIGARVGISFYVSVHNFDLMAWYLDERPVSVYSVPAHGRIHEEYSKPDGIWTLVTFANGKVACDEAFWCVPDSLSGWRRPAPWAGFNPGDHRFEVVGTDGVVNLQYPPTALSLLDAEGWKFPDVLIAPTLYGRVTGALKEEVEHFASCVRSGQDPIVTPAVARQAVELAIAAERSLHTGAPVALPLAPGRGSERTDRRDVVQEHSDGGGAAAGEALESGVDRRRGSANRTG